MEGGGYCLYKLHFRRKAQNKLIQLSYQVLWGLSIVHFGESSGITHQCLILWSSWLLVPLLTNWVHFRHFKKWMCNECDLSYMCSGKLSGDLILWFQHTREGPTPSFLSLRTPNQTPFPGVWSAMFSKFTLVKFTAVHAFYLKYSLMAIRSVHLSVS